MITMEILGVDIGGTGIKGAPVDVKTGKMLDERFRVLTPHPATPHAVADAVAEVATHFNWKGSIGCGFPAVIKAGTAYTAANVDPSWIGTDAQTLFEHKTGCKTLIINDADAAGLAEVKFGAGRDKSGVIILITLGTGIGSALIYNGVLIPNTELGHVELDGKDAERHASDKVRVEKDLSWKQWGKRLNEYLSLIQRSLWPDLIILGGGVSKDSDKFLKFVEIPTPVVPAQLLNDAGIVGAAMAAAIAHG
jgi:polyphosphate glucokinase